MQRQVHGPVRRRRPRWNKVRRQAGTGRANQTKRWHTRENVRAAEIHMRGNYLSGFRSETSGQNKPLSARPVTLSATLCPECVRSFRSNNNQTTTIIHPKNTRIHWQKSATHLLTKARTRTREQRGRRLVSGPSLLGFPISKILTIPKCPTVYIDSYTCPALSNYVCKHSLRRTFTVVFSTPFLVHLPFRTGHPAPAWPASAIAHACSTGSLVTAGPLGTVGRNRA